MRAVYAQLQDQYNRAQRWPESLQAGAMLLATNDRDVEAVRRTLTAARGLNDAVLVQKWDDRLTELTTESERARTVDAGVGTTAAQINPEHVKAEREAAAFNQAAQEGDPRRRLELVQQFMNEYPESGNAGSAGYLRFLALRDMGENAAALASAEALLTKDQTREDVMLYVAARYLNEKREYRRAIDLCRAATDVMSTKAQPGHIDEASWSSRKQMVLFQSEWVAGLAEIALGDWASAERSLRAAVALAKTDDADLPSVLSSLAWANYKMKRIPEAIRLYGQCSSSASQGASCKQSMAYIKNEYALQ